MSREWKPGDVAEVGCGVAMRHDDGRWVFPDGSHNVDREGIPTRPLVVIDPENRERVERLAKDFHESDHIAPWHDLHSETRSQIADALQTALRSLIAPPKPEEPSGLGAGVEDAKGQLWVRVQTPGASEWLRVNSAREGDHFAYRRYTDIDAVKVLGPGWSE